MNKFDNVTLSVTKPLLHDDNEELLAVFSGHNYGSYILYSATLMHNGKI